MVLIASRRRSSTRLLRPPGDALLSLALLVTLVVGLVAAGQALGQTDRVDQVEVTGEVDESGPVYDSDGRLVETPFVPEPAEARLESDAAVELALAFPKVRDWIARFPGEEQVTQATYDSETETWAVKVWSDDEAGQIALVRIRDSTGEITEAWTGPQVNWTMARGRDGAFGRKLNDPEIWLGFSALFLVGLADFRRVRSLYNLDLLVLLSFTASLWFFNRGEIFTSVPLAYPPLIYLLVRMLWIAKRGRPSSSARRVRWPTWLLIGVATLTIGFRVGLNLEQSNVIDVGYASVIGAQRIVDEGRSPYGNFPTREGEECGPPDSSGAVRDRIQDNGRCESSNERGDTYGPVTYLAYAPGYLALGWSGKWDQLPAAHFTALVADLLVILGLILVGWRYGRGRMAAIFVFAWAAFPFTQYVSSSNANDALVPGILVLGFWAATSAPARGLVTGLAAWAKFAPLVVAPLWLAYPHALSLRRLRSPALFIAGFLVATVLAFWVLLLEPNVGRAARTFWERTIDWQLGRESPFSLWGWGRYRYLDLGLLQTALKVVVVLGALATAFVPRYRSPTTLAALTAALLIAFELTLTHWFYLYIVWFLPFVLFSLFVGAQAENESTTESDTHACVSATATQGATEGAISTVDG